MPLAASPSSITGVICVSRTSTHIALICVSAVASPSPTCQPYAELGACQRDGLQATGVRRPGAQKSLDGSFVAARLNLPCNHELHSYSLHLSLSRVPGEGDSTLAAG